MAIADVEFAMGCAKGFIDTFFSASSVLPLSASHLINKGIDGEAIPNFITWLVALSTTLTGVTLKTGGNVCHGIVQLAFRMGKSFTAINDNNPFGEFLATMGNKCESGGPLRE
uniref:Uncharacterized protein n=1 Tax=Erwinia amylovora ATCC BAA-2158 TaxID=889211 RepID=E5B1C1_ERWAM|nr:hypothetical protein predicted by Glimmer/Critica [Erwinia amylovora ATCC BAA-2158]